MRVPWSHAASGKAGHRSDSSFFCVNPRSLTPFRTPRHRSLANTTSQTATRSPCPLIVLTGKELADMSGKVRHAHCYSILELLAFNRLHSTGPRFRLAKIFYYIERHALVLVPTDVLLWARELLHRTLECPASSNTSV